MKRFVLIIILLGIVLILAAQAERRIALVIGNSSYRTSPLKNPVNDATAMTATLKEMGFKVTSAYNVRNYQELIKLIRDFGSELQKGGVGLFYYAGHGVQIGGNNYLIPVEADIRKEGDVELEAVDLNRVLNEMQYARNDVNIIILDACRDNPYASSFRTTTRGLASITKPVPDCLIAYATQPNGVARDGDGANGVFTEELLKAINTPGLTLTQVMMQVRNGVKTRTNNEQLPWENSLLTRDFYFKPAPLDVAAPVTPITDAAPVSTVAVAQPQSVYVPVAKPPVSTSPEPKFVAADAPPPKKFALEFHTNIDFPGTHTLSFNSNEAEYSVSTGLSFGVESFYRAGLFGLGVGADFQLFRAIKDSGFDPGFEPMAGFIPIYLTGKFILPLGPKLGLDVFMNLGYSAFLPNSDYLGDDKAVGGGYFALGGGFSYDRYILTGSVRSNTAAMESTQFVGTMDISNVQGSLGLGMRLK